MSSQTDDCELEPYHILTREEADRLVVESLDTSMDEPEPLVRLLLILYDHEQEPRLKDLIYQLMKAAYDNSIVHSIDFQEYLKAVRQGRDIAKEARSRWYDNEQSEA